MKATDKFRFATANCSLEYMQVHKLAILDREQICFIKLSGN